MTGISPTHLSRSTGKPLTEEKNQFVLIWREDPDLFHRLILVSTNTLEEISEQLPSYIVKEDFSPFTLRKIDIKTSQWKESSYWEGLYYFNVPSGKFER